MKIQKNFKKFIKKKNRNKNNNSFYNINILYYKYIIIISHEIINIIYTKICGLGR